MKVLFFIFLFFSFGFADVDIKVQIESLKSIGTKRFNKDEKADLILIDFWASWCDPCKDSFPYYETKIKAQDKKKVLFISVNLDDKMEKAEKFLKEFPQGHVTVWDEKKKLMNLFDFDSIPYMLILDKDWKILDKVKGFNDRTKKKLKEYF